MRAFIIPDTGNRPSKAVSNSTEEISADQIGNAGRQERGAELPVLRVHRVDHPNGQRWLHHGDAHIRERDRSGCGQNVRVADECLYRGAFVLLYVYARLQNAQLEH